MSRVVALPTLIRAPYLDVRAGLLSIGLIVLLGSGCASSYTVALSYAPPPPKVVQGPKLVIARFDDRRGNEGDHGDPFRVGGVYGGYGNRLAKLMVAQPWPPQLLEALAAELRAEGVDAAVIEQPAAGTTLILDGEIRNFSTESRWGREAHIAAIIRLHSAERVLVEKRIETRESGYHWNNFNAEFLETLLNQAFAKFVRTVATDPDVRTAIQREAERRR